MIIDFKDIDEVRINGFKGGQGELDTRNFADEKVKIMKSILKPASYKNLLSGVQKQILS